MKRQACAWSLAVLLSLTLAGCGASGAVAEDSMAATADGYTADSGWAETAETGTAASSDSAAGRTESGQTEKFIYTAYLELETTDFSAADEALKKLVEDSGGYFESSSVSDWNGDYRYGDYTVRVPADGYAAFLEQAGELCHLLNCQQTQDNITEAYYDTSGRLETQQIKLQRLQDLLAQAESMEDIITIESAISETEQTIDDLSGTLRHYDAQVDYSTVNISLQEVYKLSNVEEPATGFVSRLKTAFSSGWRSFVEGIADMAVALAYCWMWLLLLAAVAAVVLRVIWKRRRRARKDVEAEPEEREEKPQ